MTMTGQPRRITFDQLLELVHHDPKKAQAYFIVSEGNQPFSVDQAINPALVDFGTEEPIETLDDLRARGSFFISIGNALGRRNRKADYRRIVAGLNDGSAPGSWVAEGDSWFHYPLLQPDDIVETLLARKQPVWTIAGAADELADMVAVPAYKDAIRTVAASVLIFSGGGNDMLGGGQLEKRLKTYRRGDLPGDMLNASFDAGIDAAIAHFNALFDDMKRHHPDVFVITHGYDYAVPMSGKGKWLYPVMQDKRFPNTDFMWDVVKLMVDRFNARLGAAARDHRSRTGGLSYHVDLRNTVVRKGTSLSKTLPLWHDEIHPGTKAFRRLTTKFARQIDRILNP